MPSKEVDQDAKAPRYLFFPPYGHVEDNVWAHFEMSIVTSK